MSYFHRAGGGRLKTGLLGRKKKIKVCPEWVPPAGGIIHPQPYPASQGEGLWALSAACPLPFLLCLEPPPSLLGTVRVNGPVQKVQGSFSTLGALTQSPLQSLLSQKLGCGRFGKPVLSQPMLYQGVLCPLCSANRGPSFVEQSLPITETNPTEKA